VKGLGHGVRLWISSGSCFGPYVEFPFLTKGFHRVWIPNMTYCIIPVHCIVPVPVRGCHGIPGLGRHDKPW
jgi:hypothetical protein